MSNRIQVEYHYWGRRGDTRRMSRGFDDIGLAANFMRNLTVTRNEQLGLLVNGKEFNWPKDVSNEESIIKHLEYCFDFVEAFYDA